MTSYTSPNKQTNKPFAIPSNGVKSEQSLNDVHWANVRKSETVQNIAPKITSVVTAQNNKTNAWYLLFERPSRLSGVTLFVLGG